MPKIEAVVLCRTCDQNEARYVTDSGGLVCGTCPIKNGVDAIKLDDVGKLLRWSREVLAGGAMGGSSFASLRDIVDRKP